MDSLLQSLPQSPLSHQFRPNLVSRVLTSTLGRYVEDLDPEHLRVHVYAGQVSLDDLTLKTSALDALGLPLVLLHGSIGRLELNIPWGATLWTSPVTLVLKDVFVLCGPKAQMDYDEDAEAAASLRAKRETLNALDAAAAAAAADAADAADPASAGFMSSLVTKVLDNIQIRVENVHIRYEDAVSRPGAPRLSAGLTLKSVAIESTNGTWEPSFISDQSSTFFHKLASLTSLALYLNPDDELSLADMPPGPRASAFLDLIHSPSRAAPRPSTPTAAVAASGLSPSLLHWVLVPTNAVAKARVKRIERYQGQPKLTLDFRTDPISLHLTRAQYVALMEVTDAFSTYTRTAKYRKFRPRRGLRPSTHPRAWWHYAIRSVVKDVADRNSRLTLAYLVQRRHDRIAYVALHKARVYASSGTGLPLDPEELDELDELESRLSLNDLRFFRSLARAELRAEAEQLAAAQAAQGSWVTSISSWFGLGSAAAARPITSSRANSAPGAPPLPQHTDNQLFRAIDYDEAAAAAHTAADVAHDYVATKLTLTLPSLSLALSHDRRDMLSVAVEGLFLDYRARAQPDSYLLHATLYSIVVTDPAAATSRFSGLVAPRKFAASGSGSAARSLSTLSARSTRSDTDFQIMSLTLEKNPIASNDVDWSLAVFTEDLELLYSPDALRRVAAFAALPHQLVVLEKVRASYDQSIAELRTAAQDSLAAALATHLRLDLHLNIKAPHIVIPCNRRPDAPALVIDLGRLHLKSDLSSSSSSAIGIPTPPPAPPSPRRGHVTPPASPRSAANSPAPPSYETYRLRLRALQVMLVPLHLAGSSHAGATPAGPGVAGQLVEKFDINVTIQSCMLARTQLPQTVVDASLPRLALVLTSLDYFNLNNVLDTLTEPIAPPPPPSSLDDPAAEPLLSPLLDLDEELPVELPEPTPAARKTALVTPPSSPSRSRRSSVMSPDLANRSSLVARFEIQSLALTLAAGSPSGPRPIIVVDLSSLSVAYDTRPYDTSIALTLSALEIHDALASSPHRTLASSRPSKAVHGISSLANVSFDVSERYESDEVHLIHIEVTLVDPKAPHFAAVHGSYATSVDLSFNQLHLSLNPATLAALLDFVNLGSVAAPAAGDEQGEPSEAGETVELADEPATANEPPSRASAAATPATIRVAAHMEALTLRLNTRDATFVSVAVLSSAMRYEVTPSTTSIHASLGDLALVDNSIPGRRWRRILEGAAATVGAPALIEASYVASTADPDSPDLAPDIEVTLAVRPIRFVFLQRFVASAEAYHERYLAPLLEAAAGPSSAGSSSSMSRSRASGSVSARSSAASASLALPVARARARAKRDKRFTPPPKLKLDIVVQSPTLVMPRSSHGKAHIVADLGRITVSNSLKPSSSRLLLDTWRLAISNMHLTSVALDEPLRIIESIDIALAASRPLPLDAAGARAAAQMPAFDIEGSSDPIQLTIIKPQYDLVLAVLTDNLAEGPSTTLFPDENSIAARVAHSRVNRNVSISLPSVNSFGGGSGSEPTAARAAGRSGPAPAGAPAIGYVARFTMPELTLTLAAASRKERIISLTLSSFVVSASATATASKLTLSLRALTIADHVKAAALETGQDYFVASSLVAQSPTRAQSSLGSGSDLVNIKVTTAAADDPDFDSLYDATLTHVELYFSQLALSLNPPVVAALVAFAATPSRSSPSRPPAVPRRRSVVVGSDQTASDDDSNVSSTETMYSDDDDHTPGGAESDGGAVGRDTRVRRKLAVSAKLDLLTVCVDGDGYAPLTEARLGSARGAYAELSAGELVVDGSVGELALFNTTTTAGLFRKIVFVRGDDAVTFGLQTHMVHGLPATTITVTGGKVNIVVINSFVQALSTALSSAYLPALTPPQVDSLAGPSPHTSFGHLTPATSPHGADTSMPEFLADGLDETDLDVAEASLSTVNSVESCDGSLASSSSSATAWAAVERVEGGGRSDVVDEDDVALAPSAVHALPSLTLVSLKLTSPTVIVPRSAASNEVILLDLGEITVGSKVEVKYASEAGDVAGVQRTSDIAAVTSYMTVAFSKVNIQGGAAGKLTRQLVANLDVSVALTSPLYDPSSAQLPPAHLCATLGDVKVTIARAEYALIMAVLSENFGSSPPSPSSGTASSVGLNTGPSGDGHPAATGPPGRTDASNRSDTGATADVSKPDALAMVGELSLNLVSLEVFRDESELGAARCDDAALSILALAINQTAAHFESRTSGAASAKVSVRSIEVRDTRADADSKHRALIAPGAQDEDAPPELTLAVSSTPGIGTTIGVELDGARITIVPDAILAFAMFFAYVPDADGEAPGTTTSGSGTNAANARERSEVVERTSRAVASGAEPRSMTQRLRRQARDGYVRDTSGSATTRRIDSRSLSGMGLPPPSPSIGGASGQAYKPEEAEVVTSPSVALCGARAGAATWRAAAVCITDNRHGHMGNMQVAGSGLEAFVTRMGKAHSSETSMVSPFDINAAYRDRGRSVRVELAFPRAVDVRLTARELRTCMTLVNQLASLGGASKDSSPVSTEVEAPVPTPARIRRVEEARLALVSASFKLVDDAGSRCRDIVEIVASDVEVVADSWTRGLNVHGSGVISAEHFNSLVAEWEPLVERWAFEVECHMRSQPSSRFVRLFAGAPLLITISPSGMEAIQAAAALASGAGSESADAEPSALIASGFAPYAVRNLSGHAVRVWVRASDHALDLEHGASLQFRFPVTRHRARRCVALQVAGGWSRVEGVDIDSVGVRAYTLSPRLHDVDHRLVCSVRVRDDGAKELVVRSSVLVTNASPVRLQLHLDVGFGDGVVLPVLMPGDMTAVPVQYAYQATLRVRALLADGAKTEWSQTALSWMDADASAVTQAVELGKTQAQVVGIIAPQAQLASMGYPYPHHVVTFAPSMVVHNGLPLSVAVSFRSATGGEPVVTRVLAPGESVPLLEVDGGDFRFRLSLDQCDDGRDSDAEWTAWSELEPRLGYVHGSESSLAKAVPFVPGTEGVSRVLVKAGACRLPLPSGPTLELVHAWSVYGCEESVPGEAANNARSVTHDVVIYAPYWMANASGIPLELGELLPNGGVAEVDAALTKESGVRMFAPSTVAHHPGVVVRPVGTETWSAVLDVSRQSVSGEALVLGDGVSRISVNMQGGAASACSLTRVVTFVPRTVVVNASGVPLCVRYGDDGQVLRIEPQAQVPLHAAAAGAAGELAQQAVSFSLEGGGRWSWSLGVEVDALESRAPHLVKIKRVLDSRVGKRVAVLQIEIAVEDGTRYAVVDIVPRAQWPVRICNGTSEMLRVRQAHVSNVVSVLPHAEARYAWDDARGPHVLAVMVEGDETPHTFAMDEISAIPQFVELTTRDAQGRAALMTVAAVVQVDDDGLTHVLSLRDVSADPASESMRVSDVGEAETETVGHVHLSTVVVSLVNGRGLEVGCVTLGEVSYAVKTAGDVTDTELAVDWVQVDDPDLLARYPVVLAPVVDASSPGAGAAWRAQEARRLRVWGVGDVGLSRNGETKSSASSSEASSERGGKAPFRTLHIVSVSRAGMAVKYYDVWAVRVARLALQIDEQWLQAGLGWMWESFWPESQGRAAAEQAAARVWAHAGEVQAPRLDVDAFHAARLASAQMYFKSLVVHALALDVTFEQGNEGLRVADAEAGAQASSRSGQGVTRSSWTDVVYSALDMTLLNIEAANLELSSVAYTHKLSDPSRLSSEVLDAYKGELLRSLLSIVGAVEFLGNPAGLVTALREGLSDLVQQPLSGLAVSPAAVARGLSRGALSFLRHSSVGLFSSANSIANSLAKGLAVVAAPGEAAPEGVRARERLRAVHPRGFVDGMALGAGLFARGMVEGASGLVRSPLTGYREGGVGGALRGLGHGALGTVVRPAVGILDMATATSAGCRVAASRLLSSSAFVRPVVRVRLQRVLGAHGVVACYSAREALVQALVWSVDGGRLCGRRPDRIVAVVQSRGEEKANNESDVVRVVAATSRHVVALDVPSALLEAADPEAFAGGSTPVRSATWVVARHAVAGIDRDSANSAVLLLHGSGRAADGLGEQRIESESALELDVFVRKLQQ
ncbi:uncharacterized protein AMSG_06001 [Thecamonas trahens ATCC 50062]|uniref:Uncharacterized protein n=1 Tax=Thecamonas trahens ATCC 50062 TaxID=461836 RepID=A0A0L0DCB8_THETB|nr:hypothetical protein AMSG_06001 [Thecamonas trahens ATCC 50062]KNC49731.1 hypothetical protein AMSG_06001 [Thecamonas trahens ATCC 50062]|eukprot:XP_013757518.1 hypothetical protein AMSG_06001 [Thecamonas trahens ATCC 50062]